MTQKQLLPCSFLQGTSCLDWKGIISLVDLCAWRWEQRKSRNWEELVRSSSLPHGDMGTPPLSPSQHVGVLLFFSDYVELMPEMLCNVKGRCRAEAICWVALDFLVFLRSRCFEK